MVSQFTNFIYIAPQSAHKSPTLDLKLKRFPRSPKTCSLIPIKFTNTHKIPAEIQKSESYPFPRTVQEMMGRSCFLTLLLVSALLVLSSSQGFGRKLMETVEHEDSTFQAEESSGKLREIIEVMDYGETGPNTNKKGYIISPPPQR